MHLDADRVRTSVKGIENDDFLFLSNTRATYYMVIDTSYFKIIIILLYINYRLYLILGS